MKRTSDQVRNTPYEWLHGVEETSAERRRGRLKVFLGYAPGVGKTYSMLSEGVRRRARGEDVVSASWRPTARAAPPNWPGSWIALREMALQRVTRAVDRTLEDYVKRKRLGAQWSIAERVAVCISSNAQAET